MVEEGITMVSVTAGERKEYNGDTSTLSYGHAGRLLNNRKPESAAFFRDLKGDEPINDSFCLSAGESWQAHESVWVHS